MRPLWAVPSKFDFEPLVSFPLLSTPLIVVSPDGLRITLSFFLLGLPPSYKPAGKSLDEAFHFENG